MDRTDAQQTLLHQKDCFACQWLENVDNYKYAKFDINTPCGPRVKKNFYLTTKET